MKRIIALVLALMMAAGLAAAAAEETPEFFDVSYFEKNEDIFQVDVSQDGESATISSKELMENRVFSTPYDTESYYSVIIPDIAVLNYPREQERQAAIRIRIIYNGTKPLNITSATFTGGGYEFTLSEIAVGSAPEQDGVYTETMAVIGGNSNNNILFLATLMADAVVYAQRRYINEDADENAALPEWTLILHGDEDVTVQLPASFWADIALYTLSLTDMNALGFIARNQGTPCEAVEMK